MTGSQKRWYQSTPAVYTGVGVGVIAAIYFIFWPVDFFRSPSGWFAFGLWVIILTSATRCDEGGSGTQELRGPRRPYGTGLIGPRRTAGAPAPRTTR